MLQNNLHRLRLKTIMLKFFLPVIVLTISFSVKLFGQDTLPKISVKNINGQIIVSWKNNYGAKIININIQRSPDSLKNFTTIGSVLNPLNRENGFVDRGVTNDNMFYRVFVAFEGGSYIFSTSSKPVITPRKPIIKPAKKQVVENPVQKSIVEITPKQVIDTLQTPVSDNIPKPIIDTSQAAVSDIIPKHIIDTPQKHISDIIPKHIFDTSRQHLAETPVKELEPPSFIEKDLIPSRKFPKPIVPSGFVSSKYIYTNKDNNLILSLPDADKVNFFLRFYDDKDKLVFVIKKVKEPYLTVEKVNFLHTGWFYYDLYTDDILLEKYKFYIGKDGRTGPPPPEINRIKKRGQK